MPNTRMPGCFCQDGFKRIGGACIPEYKCGPPQCPGENEAYTKCGNTCNEDCMKTYKDCMSEPCSPGCYCDKNYKRIDGTCVPKEDCPLPECPAHEVYIKCGTSCYDECGKTKTDCLDEKCYAACFCENGFKRIDGVCVPEFKCPPPECPGPNEIYSKCGKSCNEDCTKSYKDCFSEPCTPGCFCEPNYKRVDGECVPEEDCPPPECPANEIYIICGNSCYDKCGKSKTDCLNEKCTAGCYCQKGFKRINGICVPDYKCGLTKCPGPNEIYTKCGKSCNEYCTKTYEDCLPEPCSSGCYCLPNYKRVNGECIPEEECPPRECPVHEVYVTCGNSCYDSCGKSKLDCFNEECTAGCYCQKGMKRINGVCVPDYLCASSKCTGENEVYTKCGNTCNEDCTKTYKDCLSQPCSAGCFCEPNYKRVDGACIPEEECPSPECSEYEVYKTCGNTCYDECGKRKSDCVNEKCYAGCYCQDGFKRINGICVPEIKCEYPKCSGPNEIYSKCGTTCNEDCTKTHKECLSEYCSPGCYCEPYYKRVDGECVPEEDCPPPECPLHEVYATCGNTCYDECGKTKSDCQGGKCYAGCYCEKGYKRIDGVCVPEIKCEYPKCSGPNEIYSKCGTTCNEDCTRTHKECLSEPCSPGCYCEPYYKRVDGECVPEEDCPLLECPVHEVYSSCGNACYDECGKTKSDCEGGKCYAGCYCEKGFKRIDGVCVPDYKCESSICPGQNEIYTTCGRYCDEICGITKEKCMKDTCYGGCFCIDGYKRVDGACLPESECPPPSCGLYEIYSKCGRRCDEECKGIKSSPCRTDVCEEGCFCKPGYKRINDSCVPDSICKCPRNEVYDYSSDCSEECFKTSDDCEGESESYRCTCIEGYKRINGYCVNENLCKCPKNEEYTYGNSCKEQCEIDPDDCEEDICSKGCYCKEDYRRIDGVCVPDTECSCGENEEYTYGNECYDDCTQDPKYCRSIKTYKRCSCIEGHKRIDGICLPESECQCPSNEEIGYTNDCYEECGRDPKECSEEENVRRCSCQEGYVRIGSLCVPEDQCTCPENEEYIVSNPCEEDCSAVPESCKDVVSYKRCSCITGYKRMNGLCTEQCECGDNEIFMYGNPCSEYCSKTESDCSRERYYQGCFCQKGYKRIDGECVEYTECPCDENEKYSYGNDCDELCDTTDCDDTVQYWKCRCLPKHKRIDGNCVPQENCECDDNEVFGSGNECYESCGSIPSECAQMPTIDKCNCKPNFVRIDDVCVPDSDCSCGDNEDYISSSECIEKCGETRLTCIDEPKWRRCACNDQFKRIDGQCVPDTKCECPEYEHMDNTNECFESCGADPTVCSLLPVIRRCTCDEGYVRVDDICISEEVACSCPDDEEYKRTNDCYDMCNATCTDCTKEHTYPKCGCIEGFRRIDGVCVNDTNCPCKDNEEFGYGNDCYETCGTDPLFCALFPTEKRCICKAGHFEEYTFGNECIEDCEKTNLECRNEDSYKRCTCIAGHKRIDDICGPEVDCPCGTNEIYQFGNPCREEKCTTVEADCFDTPCYKGCFCDRGMRRNDEGQCVEECEDHDDGEDGGDGGDRGPPSPPS
uniref:EGF-like domain-containing protein n=1 Tax=Phlebotomus papatasi TaxID=29031 RepID=A0A1B0D8S3_PHLPP